MKDRGENKQYLKPPTSFGIPLLFPIVLGEMMFVEHQSFFPCKNFLGYRILGVLQIFSHSSHLANSKFIVCSPCQLPQLPLRG